MFTIGTTDSAIFENGYLNIKNLKKLGKISLI